MISRFLKSKVAIRQLMIEDDMIFNETIIKNILDVHKNSDTNCICFWCSISHLDELFGVISEAVGLIESDFSTLADVPKVWKNLKEKISLILCHFPNESQIVS